jgi:hypothetical protein
MKKGKNAKLSGYRAYKVNYGTVDSKQLKSIYLNIQTWVEPKDDFDAPIRLVNNLSRAIKHTLLDYIDKDFFDDKFIVDLDLRSSGLHKGKKSFLNLECYFYTKQPDLDFKSKEIKDKIKIITDGIIDCNFKLNKNFTFTLTKKHPNQLI